MLVSLCKIPIQIRDNLLNDLNQTLASSRFKAISSKGEVEIFLDLTGMNDECLRLSQELAATSFVKGWIKGFLCRSTML